MGCGWLGTALAKTLLAQGYQVKGTTTSSDKLDALSDLGITAFLIQLHENEIYGNLPPFLKDLDILVVNIPPRLRKVGAENYVKKMRLLLQYVQKARIRQLLFVSSTSVYGNTEGEITEDTPPNPITTSGKQLLEAEMLFSTQNSLASTIIRFGGLIGGSRHPVFHLSGKTGLRNGEELINLIHREDCIHMMSTIIRQGYWNEVFNGVYPYYPTKSAYYTAEAAKRKLPLPAYDTLPTQHVVKKRIISQNFFVKKHQLFTSIVS